MQYLKSSITIFSIIILSTTVLIGTAPSQSGRGRPRVAQPSPSAAKPEPINIPATTAVIKQEQAGTTSRFVLRNGMTVVIGEQHSTPIVAAVAYFKPGTPDAAGSSAARRLLARMILRGTVLRPGERAVAELRSLGAQIEADTSYDGTAFSLVAPSDKIKDALAIQADMLQTPSLDAEVVRRELPLVLEEERQARPSVQRVFAPPAITFGEPHSRDRGLAGLNDFDDPAAYSLTRLRNLAFTGSASIGPDTLRSLTRDQLVEMHRKHYRPENLIVAIAGDVSTFDSLVTIQQLYGAFGARPESAASGGKAVPVAKPQSTAPSRAAAIEEKASPKSEAAASGPSAEAQSPGGAQPRLHYAAERADISQSIASVGFRVPGADSKEGPVIEMLTALAGFGRASRLGRSLIDGQMVANRIESDYIALPREGLLRIQMWVATGLREGASLDKAESALFKELARLGGELPTEPEMIRAKTVLEKKFVDETGNYLGRANALARSEANGTGYRAVLDYSLRIGSVSAEDVRRVAASYLTLTNTSVHEYEPLAAPARTFDSQTFLSTVKTWAPAFGAAASGPEVPAKPQSSTPSLSQGTDRNPNQRAMIESIQALPVKDFSTLNGPRAFVREDHSQPTVTIGILFQGGRLVEAAATSGTTELMLRTILYGTPRRTSSQMADELDGLGADVGIVAERDFFGIVVSVLSRNADRALKLVRDAIEEPAFREEDIARARLGQVASIRDARDSSFLRSRGLLLEAMFPDHSYSLPPHGREEVIGKLTSEKLNEWHARVIKRELPVAIIVGDTAGSALVSSQLAEGFKRRDPETSIQVRTPRIAAAEKADARQGERTTTAVGFPGPKADSADRTALTLIEWAMNGEGGRLFRELRDKQPLVSMAAIDVDTMFAAGVISAFALAPTDSEQRVRAALLAECERISRGGLGADELSSARALTTTSRNALFQSQLEHALEYARAVFYRKSAADVDEFIEQASKINAEDIKRVASTYFKTSAASMGIVRGTVQPAPSANPKQD